MAEAIDASTAACVEYWTHPSFHGVSSRLLGVEDATATSMMMLCSEQKPVGPAVATILESCCHLLALMHVFNRD